MKKIIFIFLIFLIGAEGFAQNIYPNKLSVPVSSLSDDQIRQIVFEMKKNGLEIDQIGLIAEAKGIPSNEVNLLVQRIKLLKLDSQLSKSSELNVNYDTLNDRKSSTINQHAIPEVKNFNSKIFGSELFNNKNLNFEPNLQLPTPLNYQLAARDVIIIEVYGYSEAQYKLEVTPEGNIRIPNLGPVFVSGLTIEEATNRIKQSLSQIYSGINSKQTFVQVSLGNIRSIQVLLIGEIINPGTYTLPSLASIMNALYVSGGPNNNGSFRDINVYRGGKKIVEFDLYDFIHSGNLTNNIVLKDQDIIKVNPYKTRVELLGQVKRPAIYEAKDNESLNSILEYSGGFTDNAYKERIKIYRINDKSRELLDFNATELLSIKPNSGDIVFIDSIQSKINNQVFITGSVKYPGNYSYSPNMNLLDLFNKAGGLREDASYSRGLIFRRNQDQSYVMHSFNVGEILTQKSNFPVLDQDSVVIYTRSDLKEKQYFVISGAVNKPGTYEYIDSLNLEDAILLANGFSDAGIESRIEISRRVRTSNSNDSSFEKGTIIKLNTVDRNLLSTSNINIQPFDEIFIREDKDYQIQSNVIIEGEVNYPGTYSLSTKTETISQLISRAGGLKHNSYPAGAILLRKTFTSDKDSVFLNDKIDIYSSKQGQTAEDFSQSFTKNTQLVDINLEEILKNPNSKFDLQLEKDDIIRVPKKLETVKVFGEISFPKMIRYEKRNGFKSYINAAGGFTNQARKKGSYAIYPNGEVKSTNSFLIFKRYPKLVPGAEIYVPKKSEKSKLSTQEVIGLSSGLASLSLIIITLFDKIK